MPIENITSHCCSLGRAENSGNIFIDLDSLIRLPTDFDLDSLNSCDFDSNISLASSISSYPVRNTNMPPFSSFWNICITVLITISKYELTSTVMDVL